MPDVTELVGYESDDGIGRVTLRRPEAMNSLNGEVMEALLRALREANDDPASRVLVLAAEGEHFCVGGDPSWEAEFAPGDVHAVMRTALEVSSELRNSPKPVIGAIRGYCIGGGNEINLHLDATIASETALFAQPETKWGILPFWNTPQLLPLVVGERRAREMLMFGRMYDADQALEMGLVNAVVPDSELENEVDLWASELLDRSPSALHLVKVALNGAASQLASSAQHQSAMVAMNAGTEWYRRELLGFYGAAGARRPLQARPRRRHGSPATNGTP